MLRTATISPDGRYRFDLGRKVLKGCMCNRCLMAKTTKPGYVLWALCNPSTASANQDDPTEGRGWGFTAGWGYGDMRFVNTSPVRDTNPRTAAIAFVSAEAHLENEQTIVRLARGAALIICAWGQHANHMRARHTVHALQTSGRPLYALGLTKRGAPKHPLYLKATTPLQEWTP